ncbi:hypothetical protein C0995_009373 [Termitomyces sp. Mi166|nr:hypothetical protein C0995_009373 [Termitomyces sp. Mi166\
MESDHMRLSIAPLDMTPTTDLEQNKLEVGEEGTFYQAQLGLKPTRKHFFAPIDLAYAEAVHRDAETVKYSDEEESINSIERTLVMPMLSRLSMTITYVFASPLCPTLLTVYINFKAISTNAKWTLALSIFYVGYCLLEIPANILQRRIGANKL